LALNIKSYFRAGLYAAFGGIGGFVTGFALQVLAQAAGVTSVSTVPVAAILPLFTTLGFVLGFGAGLVGEERER
jgi:hypothetical protein